MAFDLLKYAPGKKVQPEAETEPTRDEILTGAARIADLACFANSKPTPAQVKKTEEPIVPTEIIPSTSEIVVLDPTPSATPAPTPEAAADEIINLDALAALTEKYENLIAQIRDNTRNIVDQAVKRRNAAENAQAEKERKKAPHGDFIPPENDIESINTQFDGKTPEITYLSIRLRQATNHDEACQIAVEIETKKKIHQGARLNKVSQNHKGIWIATFRFATRDEYMEWSDLQNAITKALNRANYGPDS